MTAGVRRAGAAAAGKLRSNPWHVGMAALTLGLAAGPRAPVLAMLATALTLAAFARDPPRALLFVVLLLAGAVIADARLHALDGASRPTRLAPGPPATRATLLDAPRAMRFGWRVLAGSGGRTVLLLGDGRPPAWSAGDEVRAAGRFRLPGEHERWLRPHHVSLVIEVRTAGLTGGRRGGAAGAVDDVRRTATQALRRHLPVAEAGLLRGMTLGDEAGLPREDLERLRRAGLGHIVAASGQNVALLAALVQALGVIAGVGRRTRLLAVLALIAFYVPLAGGGPSIQRAGVMGAATVTAALAARPSARWYALLLAAALTLALDPAALEDPGWQLSFAAVAAIALLAAPLSASLGRRGVPRPLAETIAITTAATIGTAPVSAAVFGVVSAAGLPANVIAAPVIALITWAGLIAAGVAQVSPDAGALIAASAGPPLAFVLGVARVLGGQPIAELRLSVFAALAVAGPSALLIGSAAARREVAARLALPPRPAGIRLAVALTSVLALAAAAVTLSRGPRVAPAPPARGDLRISFLDIGQGDATLLQTSSESLLVDSGPPGGPILDELARTGVRRLSVLVATHAQADHLGGADRVLREVPVGLLLDGRDGVRDREGIEMAAAARSGG